MEEKKLDWSEFKTLVNTYTLSIQSLDMYSDYYELIAYYNQFKLRCTILKTDPKNVDQIDYEDNYANNINTLLKQDVVTVFEKDDKNLRLACLKQSVDGNGEAIIEFQVPGIFNMINGRYIEGGQGWFNEKHPDDRVIEVKLVDKDNILGYGANTPIGYYHDYHLTETNQGWYIPFHTGIIEINSLAGYGFMPSGLYLYIRAKKGGGITTGDFYINLKWGEPA